MAAVFLVSLNVPFYPSFDQYPTSVTGAYLIRTKHPEHGSVCPRHLVNSITLSSRRGPCANPLSINVVVQLSIQASVADLEFTVGIDFDINDLAESTIKSFTGFLLPTCHSPWSILGLNFVESMLPEKLASKLGGITELIIRKSLRKH